MAPFSNPLWGKSTLLSTHGVFWVVPAQHIRPGRRAVGCPKCSSKFHKFSKEEFVKRARERWWDRFIYDKVDLDHRVNGKVCIICPVHGDFWVVPSAHVRCGNKATGCPNCSLHHPYDNADVIRRAEEIYGTERYDFSSIDVNHRDASGKVTVICRQHGPFLITINNLLKKGRKNCCPICSRTRRNYTTATFIEKVTDVHQGKYSYPSLEFRNIAYDIPIVCPVHGEFWQKAKYHILGAGCPKCNPSNASNTAEFVAKAKKVHGEGTFDYSQVAYVNSTTPVIIICPIHGPFLIQPNDHLSGNGCPHCRQSKLERKVRERLISECLPFEEQKTFPDLVGKKGHHLRFDFYLPDKRIAIECQGIQHFTAVGYFGGKKALNSNRQRDMRKWRYCLNKGIRLLYFADSHVTDHGNLYDNLDDLITAVMAK